MRLIAWLAILCSSCAVANGWEPPEDPDPEAILREAVDDTRAKRYGQALKKHVWFHEYALEHRPSLHGVRLSFALAYWKELAEVYPPALAKLIEVRNAAAEAVVNGEDPRGSFSDMASINEYLDQGQRTKEKFVELDAERPEVAQKVFGIAQSALVKSKEYELCAKYLNPKEDFQRMKQFLEMGREYEQSRPDADYDDFTSKRFTNDVATLVALLVVNDRKQEAEEIAKAAKEEWDNKEFHNAIDTALTGKVPAPWP